MSYMVLLPSYFLLLPTSSFFSFQRMSCRCCGCCGEPDHKIMFSKKMSMINMIVNGLCFGAIYGLVQWPFDSVVKKSDFTFYLLVFSLPLLILAILLSTLFIFMDKLCGCCCLSVSCCNIQDKEGVFDPDHEDDQDQDGGSSGEG